MFGPLAVAPSQERELKCLSILGGNLGLCRSFTGA